MSTYQLHLMPLQLKRFWITENIRTLGDTQSQSLSQNSSFLNSFSVSFLLCYLQQLCMTEQQSELRQPSKNTFKKIPFKKPYQHEVCFRIFVLCNGKHELLLLSQNYFCLRMRPDHYFMNIFKSMCEMWLLLHVYI